MTTQDSIRANGNSFDVYVGSFIECINEATQFFKNTYNTDMQPFVRDLGKVTIEGIEYHMYESYWDSGSDDYYYFSVRN